MALQSFPAPEHAAIEPQDVPVSAAISLFPIKAPVGTESRQSSICDTKALGTVEPFEGCASSACHSA